MPRPVAVVTDSSANLDPDLASRLGVTVVPLRLVIGGVQYLEGDEIGASHLTEALRSKVAVTTSRPGPQAFQAAYRALAAAGHEAIVSVHLSAEVSGTVDSARIAAAESPVPVDVVDSRTLGLALGFSVVAAARAEGDAASLAALASAHAARTRSLFYVDTLEYLRRGGRVSAVRALLGSALAVKPLLHVDGGRVELLEKVRTGARARARLVDLAVEHATGDLLGDVDVGVQHLAAAGVAEEVAANLRDRLPSVGSVTVREVGAAVGAHVGPGMVAVVVSPVAGDREDRARGG